MTHLIMCVHVNISLTSKNLDKNAIHDFISGVITVNCSASIFYNKYNENSIQVLDISVNFDVILCKI